MTTVLMPLLVPQGAARQLDTKPNTGLWIDWQDLADGHVEGKLDQFSTELTGLIADNPDCFRSSNKERFTGAVVSTIDGLVRNSVKAVSDSPNWLSGHVRAVAMVGSRGVTAYVGDTGPGFDYRAELARASDQNKGNVFLPEQLLTPGSASKGDPVRGIGLVRVDAFAIPADYEGRDRTIYTQGGREVGVFFNAANI